MQMNLEIFKFRDFLLQNQQMRMKKINVMEMKIFNLKMMYIMSLMMKCCMIVVMIQFGNLKEKKCY